MFHMASTDHGLATLLRGGTVVMIDGFQVEPLLDAVARHRIGWLVLIPGMVEAFAAALKTQSTMVRGIGVCGAMADLVPPHAIAEVTELLQAPYLNSFGSTETGLAAGDASPDRRRAKFRRGCPSSRARSARSGWSMLPIRKSRRACPASLPFAAPTLFSGYWQAEETNARDFRGGWFHMGDVFRRNEDGTLDFVDRAKYMIKIRRRERLSGRDRTRSAERQPGSPRRPWSGRRIRNGAKSRSPSCPAAMAA